MTKLENGHIQRLMPRHFKVIELAAAGLDVKAIAEATDMAPGSVSMVLRSPLVQHELSRLRERNKDSELLTLDRAACLGKARSILEQAAEKAAKVQVDLLNSYNPAIQLKASESLLDRVYGKGDDSRASVVNITAEQVNLLVLALKESGHATQLTAHRSPAQDPVDEVRPVVHEAPEGRDLDAGHREVQEQAEVRAV